MGKRGEFILEAAGRAVLVGFYALMLWSAARGFLAQRQPGILLYIILDSLVMGFALLRNPAARLSLSPVDWLVALVPTLLPFFISGGGADVAGMAVQYLGAMILVGGVVSLNSSIGIVAADRGIKTKGLYKIIRHPLFFGYITANIGVLLGNFSRYNLLCVGGGSLFQLVRIFREEKFLSANPVYQSYKLQTRWRLLPGIW